MFRQRQFPHLALLAALGEMLSSGVWAPPVLSVRDVRYHRDYGKRANRIKAKRRSARR